jgi:hypothetical protein
MQGRFQKLLKLHSIAFVLLTTSAIFGSLLITSYNAWDFFNGLMNLSVIGSYADFLNWFPNWGAWLFFGLIVIKISCFFLLIKAFLKELNQWRLEPLSSQHIDLKPDFIKGIGWVISLLFVYILGWFILKNYVVGNDRSLELRIFFSRGFVIQLLLHCLYYISLNRFSIKSFSFAYLFEPTAPYSLAILRFLFFGYLTFIYSAKLLTILPVVGLDHRESLPFIGWLVHSLPINPDLYSVVAYVGIISAIFVMVGWKTSFFLGLNAITIFYVMATPNFFGKLWHEQIVIWISWAMALSKPSKVWSIDAFLKESDKRHSGNNTWPIRLIWLHFGLIYFWAGFYKIWDAGFDWALSDSMINQVQLEWLQNYDKVPSMRIDHYPVLLHVGGVLVILFELLFPFLILIKSWRWIAFTGGLIMHNLLGYFLYISFLHMLQVFYAFFINFNWLKRSNQPIVIDPIKRNWQVKAGLLMLIINLFHGMFNINSYPFSAYPKYSALIPSTVEFIRFNSKKDGIDTFEEAKVSGFRWEDYGWIENAIINNYHDGKSVQEDVNTYWDMWKSKINSLDSCKIVVVELCERKVAPEGKNQVVVLDTLTILTD